MSSWMLPSSVRLSISSRSKSAAPRSIGCVDRLQTTAELIAAGLLESGRANHQAASFELHAGRHCGLSWSALASLTGPAPTPAQQQALEAKVNALAASFHARFVLPLYSAGRPNPG